MNREAVRHLRRALKPRTAEEMAAINREQERRWRGLVAGGASWADAGRVQSPAWRRGRRGVSVAAGEGPGHQQSRAAGLGAGPSWARIPL